MTGLVTRFVVSGAIKLTYSYGVHYNSIPGSNFLQMPSKIATCIPPPPFTFISGLSAGSDATVLQLLNCAAIIGWGTEGGTEVCNTILNTISQLHRLSTNNRFSITSLFHSQLCTDLPWTRSVLWVYICSWTVLAVAYTVLLCTLTKVTKLH